MSKKFSKRFVVRPLHCTPSRLRFARNLAKRVVESMQVSSHGPTAENQVAAWSAAIEASAAHSRASPPVFFDRLGGGLLDLHTSGGAPGEAAADAVMAAVAMALDLLRSAADRGDREADRVLRFHATGGTRDIRAGRARESIAELPASALSAAARTGRID